MHRRTQLLLAAAAALGVVTPLALASNPTPALATASHDRHAMVTLTSRQASNVRVPGSLTGLGFDACEAPDQDAMDNLRVNSPYWGVGVYIGGETRSCKEQTHLTRSWVRTQAGKGWRIFPLWAGLQAPTLHRGTADERRCAIANFGTHTMSGNNATAASQGTSAANRAVRAAADLAMAKGSTLFLDVEDYINTTSECNQPVMHFQSAWSKRLHTLGWKSGFYSSGASGIRALDHVRATFPGTYVMPDAIWFAARNHKANVDGDPYVRDSFWRGQRLHQYEIDVKRTYGGITFHLDENAIDIGRGSVAPRARHDCGVDIDFKHYARWHRGQSGDQVKAAQCLLKQRRVYSARLTGRYDEATARAVGVFQQRRDLSVTRALGPATWTALLSAGSTPLSKQGSASDRVRFLQRALTAASGRTVRISGVFTSGTGGAARSYQRAVGLPATGVAGTATWKALQAGRR